MKELINHSSICPLPQKLTSGLVNVVPIATMFSLVSTCTCPALSNDSNLHLSTTQIGITHRSLEPHSPDGSKITTWQNLYEEGMADFDNRKYESSERRLLAAIRIAKQIRGSNLKLACSRNALGYLYLAQDRLKEAEPLFRWSLSVARHNQDELEWAKSLAGLSSIELQNNCLDKAELYAQEALDIRNRLLEPNDPALANSLILLAKILSKQNSEQKAESLLQQGLKILTATPASEQYALADALRETALFYQELGLKDKSSLFFEQSYLIKDKFIHWALPPSVAGLVSFDWENGSPRSIEFPDYDVPLHYFSANGIRISAAIVDLWELMGVLIALTNVSDHQITIGVSIPSLQETFPRQFALELVDPTRIDRIRRERQIWDITYKRPWLANMQKTRTTRGFVPPHGHDLFRGPNVFGIYGDWGAGPKILPEKLSLELSPERFQTESDEAFDTSLMHSAKDNTAGLTSVTLDPFESRTGVLFFMNPRSEKVLLKIPVGNVLLRFPFKCRKRRIAKQLSLPVLAYFLSS